MPAFRPSAPRSSRPRGGDAAVHVAPSPLSARMAIPVSTCGRSGCPHAGDTAVHDEARSAPETASKSPEKTEYRRSAPVFGDEVEAAILRALEAWNGADPERARAELVVAEALVRASLVLTGGDS